MDLIPLGNDSFLLDSGLFAEIFMTLMVIESSCYHKFYSLVRF